MGAKLLVGDEREGGPRQVGEEVGFDGVVELDGVTAFGDPVEPAAGDVGAVGELEHLEGNLVAPLKVDR